MAARSALDLLQYVHPEQDLPLARAREPDRSMDAMDMLALLNGTAGERPLARPDIAGERPLARSAVQLLQHLPRRGGASRNAGA